MAREARKLSETGIYYIIKYNCEEEKEEYEINSNVEKRDDLYIKNRIKEILNGEDCFKLREFSKEERNRITSLFVN